MAQAKPKTTTPIAEAFHRDGYVFPIDVMTAEEAAECRRELERAEAQLKDQPDLLSAVRGKANMVLPVMDALTRRESILAPVREILGPDLLIWGASLFIKEPNTKHYVSWHQDLTYWGLDDAEEITAWVALSPATVESGCMRFVPGSHLQPILPHRDTFTPDNLLTRGQEMAVEVDEDSTVDVVLHTGQMSMHHGRMFHASHFNRSNDRRIGFAIRYITPRMRQTTGVKTVATLVSGRDDYGHFELAGPPKGVLHPDDIALMQKAYELQKDILYAGAERKESVRRL